MHQGNTRADKDLLSSLPLGSSVNFLEDNSLKTFPKLGKTGKFTYVINPAS